METSTDAQPEFQLTLREDTEILEFGFMLGGLCDHCAARAHMALLGAKIFCKICLDSSSDERYADPRYVMSYAIDLLIETDKQVEQEMQARDSNAKIDHPTAFRTNADGKLERIH